MHRPRPFLAASLVALFASVAAAHVFWVQPTTFRAKRGEIVKIQLHVGDSFPGELVPRNDAKIEQFVIVGPTADVEKPAVGRDADTTAAVFRSTLPGTYLIAYRSRPSSVTLEADKFEAYLREKGLEKIITRRAELNQSKLPGRERFSRSAKAVLLVDDTPSDGPATRNMGHRVEVVPMSDPTTLKRDGVLSLAVYSEGKPFSNALVSAQNTEHPEMGMTTRADNQGRIRFKLPVSGIWIVETVDMFPLASDPDAEWESVWASLTFEVPDSTSNRSK